MSAGSAASNLGYANITPNSNINGSFVNKDNSHYPGGFGSNQIPGLPGLAGAKYNVDAAAARVPGICMSGGGKNLKRKIKNITKRYKMSKKSIKIKTSGIKRKINATLARALGRTRSVALARTRSLAGGKETDMKSRVKSASLARARALAGGKDSAMKSRVKSASLARARALAGGKTKRRKGGNPFMAFRIGKKIYDKKKGPQEKELQENKPQENEPQKGGYSQYQNNMPMTTTYSTGGVLSAGNLGLANPVPYKVLPNCTNCVDNYNHFTNSGFPSRGH
jgi:hypothetical protein